MPAALPPSEVRPASHVWGRKVPHLATNMSSAHPARPGATTGGLAARGVASGGQGSTPLSLPIMVSAALAAAVFVVDLRLPLGVAGGVPYIAAVLVASWQPRRRYTLAVAAVCSVLTILGYFASPAGGELWKVVLNRVVAMLAIWVTAILSLQRTSREAALQQESAERQRAEQQGEAIGEARARFAGILDVADDAIVSVDGSHRIQLFNQGAEQTFGYRREEVLSQPLSILLPEQFSAAHGGHIQDFATSAVSARRMQERGTVLGRRRDGTEFPAEASISRFQAGDEQMFTVILRDVTARRQAEAERQHTAAELARANAALARSNAELEQFAYVASHDLQEPLRMVASYVQLLARRYQGQLDADADEFIAYAVDGATRMRTLIQDLLAYSRVATQGDDFAPVDCAAVIQRVVANLQISIAESDAVVTCGDLPTIMADAIQIEQLFQNLISNAIKFRAEDPPQVGIAAEQRDNEWVFSVRDNGVGIDPQYAERIFVIFQRLHGKEAYPGTGIGLAVSKRIVERHGGRIWVDPQPGPGATLFFTMAVKESDSRDR